jgi:hypothetical protein
LFLIRNRSRKAIASETNEEEIGQKEKKRKERKGKEHRVCMNIYFFPVAELNA